MSPALYANAAALSGLVIWYGVFVLLDGRLGLGTCGSPYPERIRMIPFLRRWVRPLVPVLAGAVSFRVAGWYLGAVHPLVVPWLETLGGGRSVGRFIVDVGVREEWLKLLLALPCLLWMRRQAPALLTAALVGLGFATAENRWFFGAHAEPTLLVGRVFSTTLLHAAGSGLCGAALVRAWQGGAQAWGRFGVTFLSVVVAHGLYDWAPAGEWEWLRMGGTSWVSQLMVIALAGWFFALYRQRRPEGAQVRAGLTWFCIGGMIQLFFALGITWERWGSVAALEVCGRECLWFAPTVVLTATFIVKSAPHVGQQYDVSKIKCNL